MLHKKSLICAIIILITATFFMAVIGANDSFMRSNICAVTEYEDMSKFDMVTLSSTSSMNWTTSDGTEPKMGHEHGLPGIVLKSTSATNIAQFFSFPSEAIDAYSHRKLSFAAKIICGNNESFKQNCQVILTLHSGDKAFECVGEVTSGGWNVITFDIGTWKHRKNLTGISLSFVGENGYLPLSEVKLSGPYINENDLPKMANFMSYGLYASGMEIEILNRGTPSEALRVSINSQPVNISGSAAVPYKEEDCNAIRIILSNNSDLENLKFNYNYLNGVIGEYASAVKTIPLQPHTNRFSYLVSTCDVSLISSFSLMLDSYSSGQVTIHSIEPVCVYEGYTDDEFGIISSCETDSDQKNLLISGSVYYDFLISHDDHTLVCYQLRTGETFEEVLANGDKPLATSKMSSNFSFEIKTEKLGDFALVSKYAIAALSPEGEHILLSPPISVSGDFGLAETASGSSNIKGLNSEYIYMAVDCGVGYSIIDVYLDRLINSSRSGHLYTIEDTFIYFDSDYVSQLDNKIKNLHAAGCKVYLRLLISADADTSLIPYVNAQIPTEETEFLAVTISTAEAEKHFFAVVDFLSTRYSQITNGKISGLVLGKNVNMMSKYNYSGDIGLIQYAKKLAQSLDLMARTAVISIPNIEILLSISDSKSSDIDIELLLISLCRYFDQSGGLDYSLIIEGAHAPYSLNASMFENAPEEEGEESGDTEEIDRIDETSGSYEEEAETIIQVEPITLSAATEYSDYYCTDNLYTFERVLDNLSKTYKSVPKSYVYCWEPDIAAVGGGLSAAYIYSYYSIMFSEKGSAFIVSLPDGEEGKLGAKKLSYLMKYIDTERNSTGTLCLSALEIFGAESWDELIEGYDEQLINYRSFYENSPLEALPETIKGSYALWDFSSSFGFLDWFEGSNCRSLYIDTANTGEKALCAEISSLSSVSEGYSDMVYSYEYPEDISLMPYIEFEFEISEGGKNALYEVMVIIGGEGHRIEAKKLVKSDVSSNIIVSTADLEQMKQIDYIRFCVRRISGEASDADSAFKIYLKKVTAHSDKYDDQSLENAVLEARAKAQNTLPTGSDLLSAEPKLDFIIAVAIIIIIGVAMAGFYERKQK